MRQELQALRQAALRNATAPVGADPHLGAAVPGATGGHQLQGSLQQLQGGQAMGIRSAARQQPQSLMQQQPSRHAASGLEVPGQQPEQQRDTHLHQTQASGTCGTEQLPPAAEHAGYRLAGQQLEQQLDMHSHQTQASGAEQPPQAATGHAAEHAEPSRRAQPAEPLLQPQASGRSSPLAPDAPQEAHSRHQELLEAQRQVLARLERALQPSTRQAAQQGAPSNAHVAPSLPTVAPQASEPGSHGAGSFAAAAPAIQGSGLGHGVPDSTFAASSGAPPRGSHEEAAHVMQQLQPAAGWRRPQQHLGLSPDGAAGSDEGQQKRGEPGQPLQQPGRGGGGRAAANREDAAAAGERALSLCQWQRGTQAGDQQLISGSAVQPDESAKNAQDHGVATERHWGAAQPAAASALPGAAGVLQQVKACDQQADHRHVEPAEDPGGGLEGAQHPAAPGAAGGSRPQRGLPAAGQADPQQSSKLRAEQRHQPAARPEASEVTQAEQRQQLRRPDAPQQPDRTQGVPDSPQRGRAPEGRQQPDHFRSTRETAGVHVHAPQGQQQAHGLPDKDLAEALQSGKGQASQGQQEHHDSLHMDEEHDSPPMDAADALQLRGGLSTEEQELLELQQDMQELEAQMAHAARCGACGLASCA